MKVWVSKGVAPIKPVISLPCSFLWGLELLGTHRLKGAWGHSGWGQAEPGPSGLPRAEIGNCQSTEIQASLPPLQVTELTKTEAVFEPRDWAPA